MGLEDLSVLITGGTGSFGREFVRTVMATAPPRRLIIFSRDELKQHEMRSIWPDGPGSPIRYFIGDVRDRERLARAFKGVDVVVHAAALKQVSACEYNPFEAVQTNVVGAKNVIDAAIDCGVQKVLAISTDKAVNPINVYGATKLCAEKLFVQGNSYSGGNRPRFSCSRYGNVVGSRGSVIPIFLTQRRNGKLTVTDPRMTRFWLTLDAGVRFVLKCLDEMHGGEIFVPKIPSMKILDVAKVIGPDCDIEYIGVRSGEKLHEVLVSQDETRLTVECDDMYVIRPAHPWWCATNWTSATPVPEDFTFTSETNADWIRPDQLRQLLASQACAD